MGMITWDPAKDKLNIKKHGISFSTATFFFSDLSPDIEVDDLHGEVRYKGTFRWEDKYLFIVYTVRGEDVRFFFEKGKRFPH